jgi:hypothetical protein
MKTNGSLKVDCQGNLSKLLNKQLVTLVTGTRKFSLLARLRYITSRFGTGDIGGAEARSHLARFGCGLSSWHKNAPQKVHSARVFLSFLHHHLMLFL